MFFVTHPGSTLHGRGEKPPCAAAHGIASESKGHDRRARGGRGWRDLCSEKRPGLREDKLLLCRGFAAHGRRFFGAAWSLGEE